MPPLFYFAHTLALWLQQVAASENPAHYGLYGANGLIGAYLVIKELRTRDRREKSIGKCGTEDLVYWERMKEHVTKPICEAIARDRDNRSKGHGA